MDEVEFCIEYWETLWVTKVYEVETSLAESGPTRWTARVRGTTDPHHGVCIIP
jgi:hypothetical protein